MKRSFALLLVVPVAMYAWACSSSSSSGNNETTDGGPQPGTDGGPPITDGSTPLVDGAQPGTDGSTPVNEAGLTNPINGIAVPAVALANAGFVNGLRTFNALVYASDPLFNPSVQFTFDPSNPDTATNTAVLRQPANGAIGIAQDTKKTLLMTAETSITFTGTDGVHDAGGDLVGDVVHLYADGGTALIANSYDAGGGPLVMMDSPNDLTMRKSDGMIFVTDPGFQNGYGNNHVFRIAQGTTVGTVVDTCTDFCHQNGIAISPDGNTLYVGYDYDSGSGTTPYIKKFTVAADGSLSAGTKFATVGTDLDGFAIDDNGNLYASYINGIAVFAPDGTKWGEIAIPGNTAGSLEPGTLAFGGTARTTLYIGVGGGAGAIYSVTVKVPGRVE